MAMTVARAATSGSSVQICSATSVPYGTLHRSFLAYALFTYGILWLCYNSGLIMGRASVASSSLWTWAIILTRPGAATPRALTDATPLACCVPQINRAMFPRYAPLFLHHCLDTLAQPSAQRLHAAVLLMLRCMFKVPRLALGSGTALLADTGVMQPLVQLTKQVGGWVGGCRADGALAATCKAIDASA